MEFKKVLIAVDESPYAARAAEAGVALARQLGAVVAFVAVAETAGAGYAGDTGVTAEEWIAMVRRDAQSLLSGYVARAATVPPALEFLEEGRPAARIVEAAREWAADVIVMGTHGRSAVTSALLGSVAQGVLHHASCPVMVVREP